MTSPCLKPKTSLFSHWDRLAADLVRRFPCLADDLRVGRAVRLLEADAVTALGPQSFEVQSQSGNGAYRVNLKARSCGCPDSGKGHVCKHRIASFLFNLHRQT